MFKQYLKECADSFRNIDNKETIRIITHMDTDGICAAAILTKAMIRERKKFSVVFVNCLTKEFIKSLASEPNRIFVFLDLGTSHITKIKQDLTEKTVYILDHHSTRIRKINEEIRKSDEEKKKDDDEKKIDENIKKIDEEKMKINEEKKKSDEEKNSSQYLSKNIFHVNPHIFGVNGSKEISGAGVAYIFAKELNLKNMDLACWGILGAIGDSQENNGFSGLNDEILKDAIDSKKISVETGIRFFGAEHKPLFKLLKNCTDFYIPGITGQDDKAQDFLSSIGIEPRIKGRWTKLDDLNDVELKKLIEKICFIKNNERSNEEKKEGVTGGKKESVISNNRDEVNDDKNNCSIYGNKYILCGASQDIRDLRELSTVLNACGRLDKASIGLGLLLGDKKSLISAIYALNEYKKEILNGIKWIETRRRTNKIIEEKGYTIINAEENISYKILGTIMSMLSRNHQLEEGTYLLALARTKDSKTKISFRISGDIRGNWNNRDNPKINQKVNLVKLLGKMVEKFDGEYGGHSNAAGGLIDTKHEKQFIEFAKNELGKKALEEVVE